MRKPNLFVVGAAKSGTTALYDYLDAHPDIFMSALKEPQFFGNDPPGGAKVKQFTMSEDEYLKLFADARTERYLGEATPNYLLDPSVAQEIYEFYPQARILMSLRKPVDLLHSVYQHRQFMGSDPLGKFEEIVIPALQRSEDNNDSFKYRRFIQYSNVQRYFELFGREQVCVLIFENWVKNPQKMYANLMDWLDLSTYDLASFEKINASKIVRNTGLARMLQTTGLTPSRIKHSALFNLATKLLPTELRNQLVNQAVKLYTRPAEKIPLSPETHAYLLELVEDEIVQLEVLLEQDLSHWRK